MGCNRSGTSIITAKRALVVGINTYTPPVSQLSGCIADAEAMGKVLERNVDGNQLRMPRTSDNMEDGKPITRAALRRACTELFADARTKSCSIFQAMAR